MEIKKYLLSAGLGTQQDTTHTYITQRCPHTHSIARTHTRSSAAPLLANTRAPTAGCLPHAAARPPLPRLAPARARISALGPRSAAFILLVVGPRLPCSPASAAVRGSPQLAGRRRPEGSLDVAPAPPSPPPRRQRLRRSMRVVQGLLPSCPQRRQHGNDWLHKLRISFLSSFYLFILIFA